MSIHRYAAKADANQPAIVAALEAAGASVEVIRQPVDLAVGFRGVTILMECKVPKSKTAKGNANQQSFMARWRGGPVALVDGPEAALRAIGAVS